MPIGRYVENLKEKPESHRRRVQLFASAGIAVLIFAIWAVTFGVHTKETISQNNSTEDVDSPFSLIRDNVSAAAVQVKDGFVIIRDSVKNLGQ